jgi:FlaA1/EpsC-like NDP-sugar epimerase
MSPNFRRVIIQRSAKLLDLGIMSSSFFAALAIASDSYSVLSFAEVLAIRIQVFNLIFFVGFIMVCAATFTNCGFYVSHRLSHWRRRVREIFLAVSFITGLLLLLRSPLDFHFASNRFLLAFWFLNFGSLLGIRMLGQQLLYLVRLRGRNLRSIVVVGEGSDAAALAERIEKEPALGYRVVRIIDAKEI